MKNLDIFIVEKLKINKHSKLNEKINFTKEDKYYCEVIITEFPKESDLSIETHDINDKFLDKISKLKTNEHGFYEETYYLDFKRTTIYLKINDCIDLVNNVCLDLEKNKKELKDKYFNKRVKLSKITYDDNAYNELEFLKNLKERNNL